MSTIKAVIKLFLFLNLCLFTIFSQSVVYLLFRNSKFFFVVPTFFHRTTKKIFGISIEVRGEKTAEKNVIYVSNHVSDMDIPVLGSLLPVSFISKAEVRNWPVFGQLAVIAKTVFIARTRDAVTKCIIDIDNALEENGALILFPEGTSTDGSNVIPFKSSLYELFLNEKLKNKLVVQPITITLTHTDGKAIKTTEDRNIYAYYGDIEMGEHIWRLAKSKGAKLTVDFLHSHKAADFNNRKEFAAQCHQDISDKLQENLRTSLAFKNKVA